MSRAIRNLYLGFPTRSDIDWAVQPQRMARFEILDLDSMEISIYAAKTKAPRAADLRLPICKKQVFS